MPVSPPELAREDLPERPEKRAKDDVNDRQERGRLVRQTDHRGNTGQGDECPEYLAGIDRLAAHQPAKQYREGNLYLEDERRDRGREIFQAQEDEDALDRHGKGRDGEQR